MTTDVKVWLLPGWLDSGPGHWQTLWEEHHGCQRLQQDDWQWPKRGDWMMRLDEVLLADEQSLSRPVVLAAHSLGCLLVAAWAAHSRHTARVRGALLVAPPDIERDDLPPQVTTWRPMPRQRLPFASIMVASQDDPYCAPERAAQFAAGWGSEVVLAGPRGHLNAESGLGDWPEGRSLLRRLTDIGH